MASYEPTSKLKLMIEDLTMTTTDTCRDLASSPYRGRARHLLRHLRVVTDPRKLAYLREEAERQRMALALKPSARCKVS